MFLLEEPVDHEGGKAKEREITDIGKVTLA
jgi:hypothetical protein